MMNDNGPEGNNRTLRDRSGQLREDHSTAVNFSVTLRGQYILSKALKEAIEVMRELRGIEAAPSDLADMEYLYNNLYTLCKDFPPASDVRDVYGRLVEDDSNN